GTVALPHAFFVQSPDGLSKGATSSGSASELKRQAAEHRFTFQITATPCDLVLQDFIHCEMLHQRNNVGKSFMKSQHVLIRRLVEPAMHAVKDRVRCFMRNDVMR